MLKFAILFYASILLTPDLRAQSKQSNSNISRVLNFKYSGFGDNNYSTMQGQIYISIKPTELKDTLQALAGAKVTVLDPKGILSQILYTNKKGEFTIRFRNGTYSLLIEKGGYQPILVENYMGKDDQFCFIEILMEKGSQKQNFRIPDNKLD
jgi:hypothetical protein